MKEAEAGIWSCLQSVDIRLTLDLSTVCTLPQEREDRGLICGVATYGGYIQENHRRRY